MRFSVAWLRELVNPHIDAKTLAAQLGMAGIEVGAVLPVAGEFTAVVVGRVLSIEPHPAADKLRVCKVQVASDAALQIVCGAANVAAGQCVPVAMVGAVLPEGQRIEHVKLRGVESAGMICSAAELGLEDKSSGIMVLPDDAPIGQNLRSYLDLNDQILEIELTPDRGDCLSLIGIAREVGVINRLPVATIAADKVPTVLSELYQVQVNAPQACPHYACNIIRGLDPLAKTPQWLRERLRRSGIRAINPVVDVTNYVLLELGQPMHSFDLACLDGPIEVRLAKPGERLLLLDGKDIVLNTDSLIIADANKPLALAGIMGGQATAVTANTRDVLLESAFFTPQAISGRARTYGIMTDSAYRFERGVDPGLQVRAIERATRLLIDIAGGKAGPILDITAVTHMPKANPILLRRERLQQVLGVTIADTIVVDILQRLGMVVVTQHDGWQVTATTARFDINLEVDLIAEVGRIYGYDKIPRQYPSIATTLRAAPKSTVDLERAKDLLVARGYQEVITYGFVNAATQELLDPKAVVLTLTNPLSKDLAVMRTSLWPGLLAAVHHNQTRQCARVRIFESGVGFYYRHGSQDDGLQQVPLLGGLATGSLMPEQWALPTQGVDFFDVKSDVEMLLGLLGLDRQSVRFVPQVHPALHPGQSAAILLGRGNSTFDSTGGNGPDVKSLQNAEAPAVCVDTKHSDCGPFTHLGWLGTLHPAIQQQLGLPTAVIVFELQLQQLISGGLFENINHSDSRYKHSLQSLAQFRPLSKFPSTRRDVAIVVERRIQSSQVLDNILTYKPESLQDVVLFDVYTDGIGPNQKSLAIGLVFQDMARTLSDTEIDDAVVVILKNLENYCGAVLRT